MKTKLIQKIKEEECIFCTKIKNGGDKYGKIKFETPDVVSFEPLNPVTKGHLLVVPVYHVDNFGEKPVVSARAMEVASRIAHQYLNCNIIVNQGEFATQTVYHLHIHIIPRRKDDGIVLPWTLEKAISQSKEVLVEEVKKKIFSLTLPNGSDVNVDAVMWILEDLNKKC